MNGAVRVHSFHGIIWLESPVCLWGRDAEGPSAQPQSELGTSPGDAFPPDFCRVLNGEAGRAAPGWPKPLEACLVADWGEEVGSSWCLDVRQRKDTIRRARPVEAQAEHRRWILREAKARRGEGGSLHLAAFSHLQNRSCWQAGWGPTLRRKPEGLFAQCESKQFPWTLPLTASAGEGMSVKKRGHPPSPRKLGMQRCRGCRAKASLKNLWTGYRALW